MLSININDINTAVAYLVEGSSLGKSAITSRPIEKALFSHVVNVSECGIIKAVPYDITDGKRCIS
jgi:hypothetical protein